MTGNFTEIVQLIAPASAVPGKVVTLELRVRNKYSAGTITVTATGDVNGTPIYFGAVGLRIAYNEIRSFYEAHVMPSTDAKITAWSWYWGTDGAWHQDDEVKVTIAAGISYPASDISRFDFIPTKGSYVRGGQVPFSGTYLYKGKPQDGTLTISLGTGIYPSFTTVYTCPSVREAFAGSADWVEGTVRGGFTLPSTLVVGQTYSVRAVLKTEDGTQEIDTDWGMITIVADGVDNGVPTKGITEVMIRYVTSTFDVPQESIPPVGGVVTNYRFKIKVTGANPSATKATQMGIHYVITKPDGSLIDATVMEGWPYTGGGGDHTFIEPGVDFINVDQAGNWQLTLELLAGSVSNVIDTWQGAIFTAEQKAVSVLDLLPALITMMMISIMMPLIMEPIETMGKIGGKVGKKVEEYGGKAIQIFLPED